MCENSSALRKVLCMRQVVCNLVHCSTTSQTQHFCRAKLHVGKLQAPQGMRLLKDAFSVEEVILLPLACCTAE